MKKIVITIVAAFMLVGAYAAQPVQYRILESTNAQALSKQVENYLRMGWRLAGPMRVQNSKFYQAITRGGETWQKK